MKKLVIILFLSLIYSLICKGQKTNKYFESIYKAELSICDNNYKKASKHYKNAFKAHSSPFNKDYQNALLCNCMIKNKKMVTYYFSLLRNRDVNIDGQVESKCRKTIGVSYWSNLYDIPIIYSIDTTYKRELKEILKKDQAIRKYSIRKNPTNHYDYNSDTIRYVDSLNLLKLKQLIDEKGFPSEAKVGNNFGFYLSVLHNQQWERNDLDSIIYKNVLFGNFSPYRYARLYDYWVNNISKEKLSYRIGTAIKIDEKIYFDYWTIESSIDSLRTIVYINPMETQRFKIQSNKGKEGFSFHGSYLDSFIGLDEDTKAKLIKSLNDSRIEYENSKKNDTNNKRRTRKKHR
ncbi:MAG: hypothetical protein AB8G11_08325 [Saprospiraceae bacterium]